MFLESTEDTSSPLYKHQYIIFDKNRLLPDYVIFLEYDPEGDSKLKVISSSSSEEYFETNEKIINEAYYKAKATVDNEVCYFLFISFIPLIALIFSIES